MKVVYTVLGKCIVSFDSPAKISRRGQVIVIVALLVMIGIPFAASPWPGPSSFYLLSIAPATIIIITALVQTVTEELDI